MRVAVVIVAAGSGQRFGHSPNSVSVPKQYQILAGKPVLNHSIEVFQSHSAIDTIQPVIGAGQEACYFAATAGLALPPPVIGGKSRQESVLNGLRALPPDTGFVLIHDAARPLISSEMVTQILDALQAQGVGGVFPALPVIDTLHLCDTAQQVVRNVPRAGLYAAQTPQAFVFSDILAAHEQALAQGRDDFTDDVDVARAAGVVVQAIAGDPRNRKLTLASDLVWAEGNLMQSLGDIRVGQGFDVHGFTAGDGVTLCGVRIPHSHALAGHSDADVALHAATDAVLGALAAGDIGQHFPPSDIKWRGVASDLFLAHALKLLRQRGGVLAHLDVTLICEAPKIAPFHAAMVARLAEICGVSNDRIAVKATTTEKLGFTGRGEGIAAQAVATIRLPWAGAA